MRNCYQCHQEKELSEFPVNKSKGKGHGYKCLECQRRTNKEYYDANRERLLNQKKEYLQSIKGTEVNKIRNKKHNEAIRNNPIEWAKTQARAKVKQALRIGKLTKHPCEVCADTDIVTTKVHAHHYKGYELPLEVQWLCQTHHIQIHRQRIESSLSQEVIENK